MHDIGTMLNLPKEAFGLDRDRVSGLLQYIPGAVVPVSYRVDRSGLERLAAGGLAGYPLIVRPCQPQAGLRRKKLESATDTAHYLLNCSEKEFFLTPYIDYRSADGLYRKCRLMLVGGQALACHYAISDHWMVHYDSAGMDSEAKRDEEARFLSGFDNGFARRHGEVLSEIATRIGLDYLVLDCGETQDGQLLFFDADNCCGLICLQTSIGGKYTI